MRRDWDGSASGRLSESPGAWGDRRAVGRRGRVRRRYNRATMDPSPPIHPGGSRNRALSLALLTLGLLAATAWLVLRPGERGPRSADEARASATAAPGDRTPDAAGAAAGPTVPADAPEAVARATTLAALLATATAAGPEPRPEIDALAPARALETAGYAEEALATYETLARQPGATGIAATAALARLALDDGDAAQALALLEGRVAPGAAEPAALGDSRGAGAQSPGGTGAPAAGGTDAAPPEGTADAARADRASGQGEGEGSPAPGGASAAAPIASEAERARVLDRLEAAPEALYLYGLALEGMGRPVAAALAFDRYGAALPAMADAAALAAGTNRFQVGDYPAARADFERSLAEAGDSGIAFLAALRRGNALLRLGPPEAALAAYADAHARAGADYERAQALAGMIAVEVEAGREAEAARLRLRLVDELPATELAAAALERLRAAGVAVPAEDEAAVLAGAGDPAAALARLDGAISADPAHPSAWRLDRVAARRALGDSEGIVAEAERFLAERPEDALAPELAWEGARALDRLDRDAEAVEAYAALARGWPAHARAPEALWQRAWLVELLQGRAAAAEAFEALAAAYPADLNAAEARFRSGLMAWLGGDLPQAAERWTALSDGSAGADRARAEFWLGRAAGDLGNEGLAGEHWAKAAAADSLGFYGLRAAERLGKLPAGSGAGPVLPQAPVDPASGAGAAQDAAFDAALAAWLSAWQPGTGPEIVAAARAAAAGDAELRRARAWRDLGERGAAVRALRRAAEAAAGDPLRLAALARAAAAMDLADAASAAAGQALLAAPPASRAAAPPALARLAYPDAYGELVRAEADARGLPRALLFGLIRQESRFDPGARSSAGALGLTQVMPDTGRGIAGMLGDAGFEVEQLLRADVAIRYGAAYLAAQLERFDGATLPALAAYNGGPGNAQRWLQASGGDLDLFVELVDFRETRAYLRRVTEHAAQYRRLYPEPR